MRKFIILLLNLIPVCIYSQETIEADRPSETQSTETLHKAVFQSEIGFMKEQANSVDIVLQHPDALLRFGLLKNFELRLEMLSESQKLRTEKEFRYGLQPIQLGLKFKLFELKDNKFSSSFLAHAGIPVLVSQDHDPEKVFHKIRMLFKNELSRKLKVEYNIGTDWNSEENIQNWVYTFSPSLDLSDHLNAFIEIYGYFKNHNIPEHDLAGGFAYIIGKNIQVDISGGIGLNQESPDYFVSAGFAFQLK